MWFLWLTLGLAAGAALGWYAHIYVDKSIDA